MKHYRISEIKTNIDEEIAVLPVRVAKKLRINESEIVKWEIRKKSIDSRQKLDIKLVYTVDFWCEKNLNADKIKGLSVVDEEDEKVPEALMGSEKLIGRPIVVGMGPCGSYRPRRFVCPWPGRGR